MPLVLGPEASQAGTGVGYYIGRSAGPIDCRNTGTRSMLGEAEHHADSVLGLCPRPLFSER
jgi:hypothetical protein